MRHHYVPEFLLKNWATQADGRIAVYRLDLERIACDLHTPKHTGFEDNLFALSVDKILSWKMHTNEEVVFKEIDGKAAEICQRFIAEEAIFLSHEDRLWWARFLMSLRMRQPAQVEYIKKRYQEALCAELAKNRGEFDLLEDGKEQLALEEWARLKFPGLVENFGLMQLPSFVDNERMGQQILDLKWKVLDFRGVRHSLLLSDHTCITDGGPENLCLLLVPISPTKAFMCARREIVDALSDMDKDKQVILINQ